MNIFLKPRWMWITSTILIIMHIHLYIMHICIYHYIYMYISVVSCSLCRWQVLNLATGCYIWFINLWFTLMFHHIGMYALYTYIHVCMYYICIIHTIHPFQYNSIVLNIYCIMYITNNNSIEWYTIYLVW